MSGPKRDVIPDPGRLRRAAEMLPSVQDLGLGAVHPEDHVVEVGGPRLQGAVTASKAVNAAENGMECRLRGEGSSWGLARKERRLVMEIDPSAVGYPALVEMAGLLNQEPSQARYVLDRGKSPLRGDRVRRPR